MINRQTDYELMDTQTNGRTEEQRDRQKNGKLGNKETDTRRIDVYSDRQTDRQKEWKTDWWMDGHTDEWSTKRQTERLTYIQTDK